MALVSGRPISFQMDLYQPLYVPAADGRARTVRLAAAADLPGPRWRNRWMPDAARKASPIQAQRRGCRCPPTAKAPREDRAADYTADRKQAGGAGHGAKQGRGVVGHGADELGDFFQYAIEHPVTLPRQKSPCCPSSTRTSRPRASASTTRRPGQVSAARPASSQNTTGLHLMQGPITVFEGSNYAGDARILDLAAQRRALAQLRHRPGHRGRSRRPKRQPSASPRSRSTRASSPRPRGCDEQTKTYTVKNRSEQDRVVLIEHPYRPDFKLVSKDKPAERARDVYRFELKVAAGKAHRRR